MAKATKKEEVIEQSKAGTPMPDFERFTRKGVSEMRPYVLGEDLTGVSVSKEDNPEKDMGMIARNPKNHKDQWYVAKAYFDENLQPEVQADWGASDYGEIKNKPLTLTFYDRLLIEKEELSERTTDIQSFIDKNPVYKNMDQVSRSLMVKQFKAMKEYLDALDRRIGMIAPAIVEEV